jgi:hypothetical protein
MNLAAEPTSDEIEALARERFNTRARVFSIWAERRTWWVLSVRGEILGMRRELSDLPSLIELKVKGCDV